MTKKVNKKLEKAEGQMVQKLLLISSPDSAVRSQNSVSITTEPNSNSD